METSESATTVRHVSLWRRCLSMRRGCAVQSLRAGVSVISVRADARWTTGER